MSNEQNEQDARIALLDYFGSELRYWGTVVLSLAVAFVAIVQVKDTLCKYGVLDSILWVLANSAVYASLRFLWHGRVAEFSLKVEPETGQDPLLWRLLSSARSCVERERSGRFLSSTSGFKGGVRWVVLPSLIAGMLLWYLRIPLFCDNSTPFPLLPIGLRTQPPLISIVDVLTPWVPFVVSFAFSLIVIWLLADVLKLRLYVPLEEAKERRRRWTGLRQQEGSVEDLVRQQNQFFQMNYKELRRALEDPQNDSLSPPAFRSLELAYIYQANRIHVHHFFYGIILMPFSWALFVYVGIFYAMILSGFIYALFISELRQLLTQKWGP